MTPSKRLTTNKDNLDNGIGYTSRRRFVGGMMAGVAGLMLPWGRGNVALAEVSQEQVIVAFSQEPTVLNPLMPHIEVDDGIHWNLFDPLFRITPKGEFVPSLAVEVPTIQNGGISSDGLQWHIKLRQNVTWHDGQPFSAEDVKFSLELINDPKFRANQREGHNLVYDIEVLSPYELRWKMKRVYSPYLALLSATCMVPKHIIEGAEDPNDTVMNKAPIGTGPYKWGERIPGDHITLIKNPDYFDMPAHIEKVIFSYVPDLNIMYAQYRGGDVDFVGMQGISPDLLHQAESIEDHTLMKLPVATVESVTLNLGRPQFKEKVVREALYKSIDKKGIIDVLQYGIAIPTETFMPRQSAYFNPDLPSQEFDLDAANAMLDEAGWKRGADGIRAKEGVRLSFENSTTSGNQVRELMQQFLQQTWLKIGVEMRIHNLPAAVIWGDFYNMSKFDSVVVGNNFLTGGDPDVSNYFHSNAIPAQGGAGLNNYQFRNTQVDELLTKGQTELDHDKRVGAYHSLQRLIREELPLLPLFQYVNLRGRRSKLKGFENNVNVRIETWNVKAWYWS